MQLGTVLVLAFLAVPAASSSVSALNAARLWLTRYGGGPSGDQLAELKAANPQAYAIVKALLAKHSLGLLDPKHPSPSFTPASAPSQEEEDKATAVQPADMAVSEPAPAHRDWLSWRPQKSAMDDESAVQNVLGAVAELKGAAVVRKAGLLSKHRAVEDSPLAADEDAFLPAQSAPVAMKPKLEDSPLAADEDAFLPALSAPVVPKRKPAAMLKVRAKGGAWDLDFSSMLNKPKPKPRVKENSYLKGLDLSMDSTPKVHEEALETPEIKPFTIEKSPETLPSTLDSFSWDSKAEVQEEPKPKIHHTKVPSTLDSFSWDSKPEVQQEELKPKIHHAKVQAAKKKKDSLLAWLGVEEPAPKVEKPVNPYMSVFSD